MTRSSTTALGQIVLVLQGGGALGAYQVGVYQALHEAGLEPDWVIGTSIGAINGAIIAGNAPQNRVARLDAFWGRIEQRAHSGLSHFGPESGSFLANLVTMAQGIAPSSSPIRRRGSGRTRRWAWSGRSITSTSPLAATLAALVDLDSLNGRSSAHRRRGECEQRRDALFRQPR